MNWRIKGVVQKGLSAVPGGTRANDLLQRTLGGLKSVDRTVDSKVIDDWVILADQLAELGVPLEGAVLLEIGTGWMPIFPFCFALCGARTCHTFDIEPHLNPVLATRALQRLEVHLDTIARAGRVPRTDVEQRYRAMLEPFTVRDLLARFGIAYHAPGDATQSALPAASVDVVFSNSVLEHVPVATIVELLTESARVLKPTGVAIHSVNCGDHYAYFDRSITFINYLRYTEREWRLWNNKLLYQNRLRPIDFLALVKGANLALAFSRYRPKERLYDVLRTFPLAPEFQHYAPEQICSTSIDFAYRPTPPSPESATA